MAHWKELVREKRRQQAESIPTDWRLPSIPNDFTNSCDVIESCGILSNEEKEITNTTDVRKLLVLLASGNLSSVQVTTAFSKRAAIAHQLINCCTEMFFDTALVRARELDEYLATTGKVVGPLHGLPVSIKDGFEVEGYDTTVAYIVPPVAGPITADLHNVEYYMESAISSRPWEADPKALPIPWRRDLAQVPVRPLKVAFIFDDGVVKPQPPITRALRETAEKFRKAGHEVIEWDTSLHDEGINLWLKAVMADGGEDCRKMCELVDEPLIPGMLVGTDKDRLSISQRQELEKQKLIYRESYLAQWRKTDIDALIMPVMAWVNFKPRTWVESKQLLGYSAIWNLLDYTALTVPVTNVHPVIDAPDEEWLGRQPRNESDAFNQMQCEFLSYLDFSLRRGVRCRNGLLTSNAKIDDVNLVKGMPVSVQVVTGRFGEEKAVSIAKVMAEFE
ncbi:hypothetical protein FQN50_006835 [Emmonsiellopsis sp. PD_5]|nr:hypothetical protein FQN50_006835 [Emmonsiellopsis sp. PD_5]